MNGVKNANQQNTLGANVEKPRRVTKIEIPLADRAAYTPREFAGIFGKSQSWAYRRLYDNTVRAVKVGGVTLIPSDEVQRLLSGAGLYNEKEAK